MFPPGTPDILMEIIEGKSDEIASLRPLVPEFKRAARDASRPLDFAGALRRGIGISVIAEVKRASPSAGVIAEDFDPERIAVEYGKGGADAVSVLTEQKHFLGSMSHLAAVRKACRIPVLRKDFIVDAAQIYETRAAGADSFLLIAAALSPDQMKDLLETGRSLGMEPLVEIHTEDELASAVACGAEIVGVNSRDLRTFTVDTGVQMRLAKLIPPEKIKVAESGIKGPADAARLRAAGFSAVLVGEALMRAGLENSANTIKEMKRKCMGEPI